MSILRDGFPDVHSDPLEPFADFDAFDPDWEGDVLDDVLCDLPAPCEPRLPFAEWVSCQASWFRSQGTPAGDWAAAEFDQLAAQARELGAENPGQFDSRRRQKEASDAQDLRAEGFRAGQLHGPGWHYAN